ncbi:hypothetical protein D3C72_1872150 [compost metagenome]
MTSAPSSSMACRAASSSLAKTTSSLPCSRASVSGRTSIERIDASRDSRPYSLSVLRYSGYQRGHMVRMLNLWPSMLAVWNAAMPGASTGIDRRERRAARPESLTVLMHSASKPSRSALRPAAITACSMMAMS